MSQMLHACLPRGILTYVQPLQQTEHPAASRDCSKKGDLIVCMVRVQAVRCAGEDASGSPGNASTNSPDCCQLMARITQQVLQEMPTSSHQFVEHGAARCSKKPQEHLLEDKDSACDIVSEDDHDGVFCKSVA